MKNVATLVPITRPIIVFSVIVVTTIAILATPYMAWATAAYALMVIGVVNRKNRIRHAQLMQKALFMDLALVLLLEVSRDAIGTALSFRLGPLQQAHIAFSTLALGLYFPVFFLGRKLLKGPVLPTTRAWHLRLAKTAFVLRSIGFILMFSLLAKGVDSAVATMTGSRSAESVDSDRPKSHPVALTVL